MSRRFSAVTSTLSVRGSSATPLELDGFREWLHMKLDGPGNQDWLDIIAWKYGHSGEATAKMFELVDEFRLDVERLGIEQIIEDHWKYEMHRYNGNAFTSRIAAKQWGGPIPVKRLLEKDL